MKKSIVLFALLAGGIVSAEPSKTLTAQPAANSKPDFGAALSATIKFTKPLSDLINTSKNLPGVYNTNAKAFNSAKEKADKARAALNLIEAVGVEPLKELIEVIDSFSAVIVAGNFSASVTNSVNKSLKPRLDDAKATIAQMSDLMDLIKIMIPEKKPAADSVEAKNEAAIFEPEVELNIE